MNHLTSFISKFSDELSIVIQDEKRIAASQKDLALTHRNLSANLANWGKKEGDNDMVDITAKWAILIGKLGDLHADLSRHYDQYRSKLKTIRMQEQILHDIHERRRQLHAKLNSSIKSSARSEAERELFALEQHLPIQTSQLANYKRVALQEAMQQQMRAIAEHAEKAAIIAGYGRLLAQEIDTTEVPVGHPRPIYNSSLVTTDIINKCSAALESWRLSYGPQELSQNPLETYTVSPLASEFNQLNLHGDTTPRPPSITCSASHQQPIFPTPQIPSSQPPYGCAAFPSPMAPTSTLPHHEIPPGVSSPSLHSASFLSDSPTIGFHSPAILTSPRPAYPTPSSQTYSAPMYSAPPPTYNSPKPNFIIPLWDTPSPEAAPVSGPIQMPVPHPPGPNYASSQPPFYDHPPTPKPIPENASGHPPSISHATSALAPACPSSAPNSPGFPTNPSQRPPLKPDTPSLITTLKPDEVDETPAK
ncbi:uncharacterized protein VTP21DRAFT_4432 [Calcarisporiella thermophila]|uniref:uncharacterized protein n=1 Tax=Calcarisporiella thermophila TaxID=911321 RepID=UPI0037434A45